VAIIVLMTLATVAGVVVLYSSAPLGVTGEWTWTRMPWTGAHAFAWIKGLFTAGLLIALIAGLSRMLSDQPGASSPAWKRFLCTVAIIAAVSAWWLTLLSALPAPFGLARGPFVLYYPRMTGYYNEARYRGGDTESFLRGYERMLRDLKGVERYLHIGTHPPGMILLNRGLLAMTSASPALVRTLAATMPDSIHDASDTIAAESAASHREFTPIDSATLWLGIVLTIVISASTIAPLTSLLRRSGLTDSSALRWAALWGFTPAVLVFLPKCDTLFACPAVLSAALWCSGLDRNSKWRLIAAGLVCFAGLFFSLAFLPIMAWLALATVGRWWSERHDNQSHVRTRATALACGLTGLLAPILICAAMFQLDLATVWRLNIINHAEFYTHNARSYGTWLLVNIGELAWAAGPALTLLAGLALLTSIRPTSTANSDPESPRWSHLGISGLLVLALLWLTGKNMGEAARLWILFLPWIALSAASLSTIRHARPTSKWLWYAAATLQAVACLAATTQIDGFGFSELK
jgi:hypothetical protein